MHQSMETGVNKPNHSFIDIIALESQSFEKDCHLSIQIGLNGFSFCINNSKEILAIESYNYSLSQLEENLKKNKWLAKNYASTNITINSKKFTIIPSLIYNNKDRKKYLKLNHVRIDQLDFLLDVVKPIESHIVYGISIAEQDIITTFFPKSKVKHFSSIYLPNILTKYKNNDGQTMIVNIDYMQMHITVIENSKLLFFNVFDYKSAVDCIYYILFVCEQLEINTENIKLEFMGDIKKDYELYDLAYTYIRHVNFVKRSVNLSPNIDSLQEHEYYTLLHQHLCE